MNYREIYHIKKVPVYKPVYIYKTISVPKPYPVYKNVPVYKPVPVIKHVPVFTDYKALKKIKNPSEFYEINEHHDEYLQDYEKSYETHHSNIWGNDFEFDYNL